MANPTNAAISHLYSGRATGYVTRVTPGTRNFVPKFPRPAPRRRKPTSALWQGITAVMAFVVCVSLSVFGTYEFLARRSVMEAQAATTQTETRSAPVGSLRPSLRRSVTTSPCRPGRARWLRRRC